VITMVTRTPNFFIAGAAKSGTTSLARYLEEHPQVYMSPIKEPSSSTKARASWALLYIFQLPAMTGVRMQIKE